MTNTMNTPIEEMERSLPVRIVKYESRPDSCGAGRFRGGCGLVRAYEMLGDSTSFTIVSERTRHEPWGLKGGLAGAKTEISLLRKSGKRARKLGGKTSIVLGQHDIIKIQTTGGGGYEKPRKRVRQAIVDDLSNGLITNKYVRKYLSELNSSFRAITF